jgi:hypothetical protein
MRAIAHHVVSRIEQSGSRKLLAGLHFVAAHYVTTKWRPAKNALDSCDSVGVAKSALDFPSGPTSFEAAPTKTENAAMDYDFWKAEFEQWYERTNRLYVESRASMEMLDELRRRYEEATEIERRWIVELMLRWQLQGNDFQKYDAARLLPEFEESDGDEYPPRD